MTADATPAADVQPKAKIFISYSRKDMAFADRLDAALTARGFEPLIDRSEIYAFEDWWKRIEALIGRSDTVVFVLSPDAVASEVALKEVAHAVALNKRIAPIVCRRVDDGATPEALRRLNFVFFDEPERFEASADQLAEALQTDIGWIRQHTEFGELARRWSDAGRPGGLLLRSPALEAGRALDRVASAGCAGSDRRNASLHRGKPERCDAAAQHPDREPRGRPGGGACARRAGLLATRHRRAGAANRGPAARNRRTAAQAG